MVSLLLRRDWKPLQCLVWKPLVFPKEGAIHIPASKKIEMETTLYYAPTRYCPVTIGQTFQNRYQVVGKLGFGTTSTVWLARDLEQCQHIALKLYARSDCMGSELDAELDVYRRIERAPEHHPGRSAVRSLLDSFEVNSPTGRHRCLVHVFLWENVRNIRHRNPVQRLPWPVLAFVLKRLFLALDFLHRECHVAHTDIKEASILLPADASVLTQFERQELCEPSPKKEADGTIVYTSREIGTPKAFGAPVLCDFGSAVPLDDGMEHREDIQPDIYRSQKSFWISRGHTVWIYGMWDVWEADLDLTHSYVWDMFEGEHLFTGRDPEHNTYRGRAHLVEMIALLGPPPPSMLACANLKSKFFSEQGNFAAVIFLPRLKSLEGREITIQGEGDVEDRQCFLRFMQKMLQWEPEKRSTAQELAEDEWIEKHTTET